MKYLNCFLITFVVITAAMGIGRVRNPEFRPTAERNLERIGSSSKSANSFDDYNPLKLINNSEPQVLELEFTDDKRERSLPVRIYLSQQVRKGAEIDRQSREKDSELSPVILFSHGLGGSRSGSTFLGKHWAARGYVAVFLQHPGSDEGVWQGVRARERIQTLTRAASGQQLTARVADVSAVLDQLKNWNQDTNHALYQRLDLDRVGMSGHSFGAVTTQNVSGQAGGLGRASSSEPRIKAAVVMSPGVPAVGSPDRAFQSVKIPWLLMTGTHDDSPIGEQTPESRRKVYPALPPGNKYELVLHEAEHSIFTDRRLFNETRQRKPEHHQAILALSTAFWDAYLRGDESAKAWLQGPDAKSVLDAQDLWQFK